MVLTSLIIKTLDNGEPVSKTLSNVNSDTSFANLNSFARKLNSLTTGTYVDTIRVTKESVNEAVAAE